jgi:hypothetical protein
MRATATEDRHTEIASEITDLRDVPILSVPTQLSTEMDAIVRRLVDEEPSPHKPSVAAFNSYI